MYAQFDVCYLDGSGWALLAPDFYGELSVLHTLRFVSREDALRFGYREWTYLGWHHPEAHADCPKHPQEVNAGLR